MDGSRRRWKRVLGAISCSFIVCCLLPGPRAYAQASAAGPTQLTSSVFRRIEFAPADPRPDRLSSAIRRSSFRKQTGRPLQPAYRSSSRSSLGRTIGGAILGGLAGFYLGATVGSHLEPDCRCDDPGLRGLLIGGAIGTGVGAYLGVLVFR